MRMLKQAGLLGIYVLATVQFVGAYLFLEYPYINLQRFERGTERLPFQTRILAAPLFRWADHNRRLVDYAYRLSSNNKYFFQSGIHAGEVLGFFLDIGCVLIAGWVALQLYRAGTRRNLLGVLVYPLFLGLCVVSYILHTVQNFRYVYDLPSLAFFSLGLYLIYFRKSPLLFVALFAIATLNRETTLLLLPFYLLSQGLESGRFYWRRLYASGVLMVLLPLLAYWVVWHHIVFHIFRHNPSEYFPRIWWNLGFLKALRYYPQLFSACGYLLPFLLVFRKQVRDTQLRLWLWVLPLWYCVMSVWGLLTETRIFGELLPYVACVSVLMAEEVIYGRVQRTELEELVEEEWEEIQIARTA